MLSPRVTGRAANVKRTVAVFRAIGSTGFPYDEEFVRDVAGRSCDRSNEADGVVRQLAAILPSGNRKPLLGAGRVPTLVSYGKGDPLVRYEGGIDTAEAIPGARLVGIDGWEHDVPRELWPTILDEICAIAARGGLRPGA